MAEMPSVISIINCSSEATLVADDSLTFTVTQDNDGIPCAYIIHVPVSADTTLLTDTVCQASIVSEDTKSVMETNAPKLEIHDSTETLISAEAFVSTDEQNDQSCSLVATTEDETMYMETDTGIVKTETDDISLCKNEENILEDTSHETKIPPIFESASEVDVKLDGGQHIQETHAVEQHSSKNDNKKETRTVSTLSTTKRPIQTYGKPSKESKSKEVPKTTLIPKAEFRTEVVVKTPERVTIPFRPRKRRLIMDTQKQIPIGDFKEQLKNTNDIVVKKQDMAPPTKKAMKIMEHGHVGKIFCTPGRDLKHVPLYRLFYSRLVIAPEAEIKPINTLVPLNADLQITHPSSASEVTEELDSPMKSEFTLLREKAYSANRTPRNPRPKLRFKGAKSPPAFKQYVAKKESCS